MKKGHKILLRIGIAVVIFLISFTIVTKIVVGSTKPAYLHIESGAVEVNTGNGWQTAEDGMSLSKKDSVRTLDGTAVIVLYDSSFIKLEPNTKVTISELAKSDSKIDQSSGSTWNKFTKITGMDSYEVETPNTVATVRGTEFLINAEENTIIVVEGVVEWGPEDNKVQVKEFEKYGYVNGELQKLELTQEERNMLINKISEGIELQKQIRFERMKRMRVVNWVREKYTVEQGQDMTEEEQLNAFFNAVDKGEVDDREIMKKAPVINQHPAAKQFIAFNDEIKDQEKRLRKLTGEQQEEIDKVNVEVSEDNVVTIEQETVD